MLENYCRCDQFYFRDQICAKKTAGYDLLWGELAWDLEKSCELWNMKLQLFSE